MLISLNWLKKFVDIDVSNEGLIRLIGARLVEVEGVIDETHKYDKIYVAKVESAKHIPDTHLTLCQINVGGRTDLPKVEYDENGLVQVMCGAPNVREGMLAVWIAPGAIVPASVHEDAPFVIGKRKMLGQYDSYGMLAGADELDFGDDHSGIAEIDPAMAQPGDAIADVLELNDLILEIENKSLTHRPDCFGMIGFAREVAGILGKKFVNNIEPLNNYKISDDIKIEIAQPEICPRYTAVVLEKHGELKKKYLTLQDTILAKSGMRPVDEIVDATNYLMLLTGQPLHAFDYDKFVAVGAAKTPRIVVRLARAGESLTLLDGKEVSLNENDIVITSNDKPVALAGAMGGDSTKIDDSTKKIIIESATFSLYNLRKTQMAHGIFSEAITRFTKGQPAYQTLMVAEMCAGMLADGYMVTGVSDCTSVKIEESRVEVTAQEINQLLGTSYSEAQIIDTLENVGFRVKAHRDRLDITAPAWRTDIHIKEDIIEEIGRLNGYDNIVPTLPRHATAEKNRMLELKTKVRNVLSSFGANEVLTYSFVSERLLKKAGLEVSNSYRIVNSISPELQLIRQSLVPSLLEKAYINQKVPFDKFAIFEVNKVYQKDWGLNEEGVPVEKMRLGCVIAERKNIEGTAYYKAKFLAESLLEKLNIAVQFLPIQQLTVETLPFETKRAAAVWTLDGEYLGVVGEFKNSVRRNFKLAEYLAGFELDMDMILQKAADKSVINNNFTVKDRQDITITTLKNYADTLKELSEKYPNAVISPVGIYQPDGVQEKNITFHLEFH